MKLFVVAMWVCIVYHNLILINALLTINNYISLNLYSNISKILNLSLRKYQYFIVTLTSLCTFTKVHVMYVTPPEFMNLPMAPLELNRMTKYEKYHLDLLVYKNKWSSTWRQQPTPLNFRLCVRRNVSIMGNLIKMNTKWK